MFKNDFIYMVRYSKTRLPQNKDNIKLEFTHIVNIYVCIYLHIHFITCLNYMGQFIVFNI